MHVLGGLDPMKHQIANIEGAFFNILVMVAPYRLLMACILDESRHSVLLEAVDVNPSAFFHFAS